MCRIVSYTGQRKAYPILIKGLERLEYHGYDSAGVALISNDRQLNVYKTEGKVSDLEAPVTQKDASSNVGIAHIRRATYRKLCSVNTRPHYSSSEGLALIHNDIIESHIILKDRLQAKDYIFKSNTDTEVLTQPIEYIQIMDHIDLLTVIQLVLQEMIGAYAIAVLDRENPDEVIAAHKNSPLVVGIGRDEFSLVSDTTPIVEYANKMVYPEDGETAVIRRDEKLKVIDLKNVEYPHEAKTVAPSLSQLEKDGYLHFMLKEIFEQPGCVYDCMRGRINLEGTNVMLSAIIDYKERPLATKCFVTVACGTLWHVALMDKHLIESFCRIPVEVGYALEFHYRDPVIDGSDVVITISQNGKMVDTLAAVELAKSRGAFIYGICNAVSSSIPRATHTGSYIHISPEIGMASVKAFTGQMIVLTMLTLALVCEKHTVDEKQYLAAVKELGQIPEKMKEVLELNNSVAKLSKIFTYTHNFIYLEHGYSYPIALERALKLKGTPYIHAEGCPTAEMKHGPIVLIDAEMPAVVIAAQNGPYEKVLNNIQRVKARKSGVIVIITKGGEVINKIADTCIELPGTMGYLDPLVTAVPLQLPTYHIAVCKGMDVDQPCNLTKSVTVE